MEGPAQPLGKLKRSFAGVPIPTLRHIPPSGLGGSFCSFSTQDKSVPRCQLHFGCNISWFFLSLLVCLEIGLVLCDQLTLREGLKQAMGGSSHEHSPQKSSESLKAQSSLWLPSGSTEHHRHRAEAA